MKKRLLRGLMSLVMLLSLVPAMGVTASAADGTSYPIRNYKSFASYLESYTSRDLTLEMTSIIRWAMMMIISW